MYKFVIWNVTTTSPSPNKLIYILQHWTLKYFISNTHAQMQFPRTIISHQMFVRKVQWMVQGYSPLDHQPTWDLLWTPKVLGQGQIFDHKLLYPIHPWFFGNVSVINMNFDLLHDFW
jgi:hypothetical protein